MLLLTLEYIREYRRYFHIAKGFDIHETSAIRISRWVEDVLVKDGTFSIPGRKALLESDVEYEVIQIYQQVEKNLGVILLGKKGLR